jgi:hypothetical protein
MDTTPITSIATAAEGNGSSMRGAVAVHRRRAGGSSGVVAGDDDNSSSGRDDSESGGHHSVIANGGGSNTAAADRRFSYQRQQHQHDKRHCCQSPSLLFRGLSEFLGGKQRIRSPQNRQQTAANVCGFSSSSRRSSICVFASFLVWLCVIVLTPQEQGPPPPQNNNMALTDSSNSLLEETNNAQSTSNINQHNRRNNLPVRERIQQRTQMRNNNAAGAADRGGGGGVSKFLKDAASGFYNVVDKATRTTSIVQKPRPPLRQSRRGKDKDKESDLPGCTRPKWQQYNLVNCNDIHEVDLATIQKRRVGLEGPAPTSRVGYIGNGLWRSVLPNQSVVIKIMKDEHDVNTRNFERHRRDALTMERLTSSPHIVDIYAFCGNTVLTGTCLYSVVVLIVIIWMSFMGGGGLTVQCLAPK